MTVTIQSKRNNFKPYLLTGVISINQFGDVLQITWFDENERLQTNSYNLNDNDIVISMSI